MSVAVIGILVYRNKKLTTDQNTEQLTPKDQNDEINPGQIEKIIDEPGHDNDDENACTKGITLNEGNDTTHRHQSNLSGLSSPSSKLMQIKAFHGSFDITPSEEIIFKSDNISKPKQAVVSSDTSQNEGLPVTSCIQE